MVWEKTHHKLLILCPHISLYQGELMTDVNDSSKKKYYIGKYNPQEETTDISFV
jgi:hypothetical protein